ncbi:MAG TPA: DUF1080 domain-containing protein [Lacipirellulaceae bacterium]|nr:DUF1080 domain-containing protein [Lacipirellulaceae bacterium]
MRNSLTWLSTLLLLCLCITSATAASEGEAPQPDEDGWYSLFNGKDLTGWKKAQENEDTIKVVDGEIVIKGDRCHLFYVGPVNDANFKDFEWKCEILTKPNSNSGMYFHTEYQRRGWPSRGIEVQVNNTHSDPIKTGSLYQAKNIMNDSPAKDNEWFTQHVIVDGSHVVVKVNDKVVNDYVQSDPPKRVRGRERNVLSSGTFALQGHDPGSEVRYRKVLVKPLP